MDNIKSKESYKHKSGYFKRKLKSEKVLQLAKSNPKQSKLNFSTQINNQVKDCKTNDDRCGTKKNPLHKQITNISKTISSETNNILTEELKTTTCNTISSETSNILTNEIDKSNHLKILSSSNDVFEVATENIGDHADAVSEVFVAPSPNMTTQIKLAFLDQHPVHPNSNIYELPFQASRLYYRNTESGDKFLRKWLSYNIKNKKLYCNICMAFSLDRDSVWIHGASYTTKRIYDKIKDHEENCRSHEFAVQTFAQIKFKDRGDIIDLFDSSRKKVISNNREVVSRVIDIIIFLAKQNLAFRGKRNENVCDLDIFNKLKKNHENRGNFMELVK